VKKLPGIKLMQTNIEKIFSRMAMGKTRHSKFLLREASVKYLNSTSKSKRRLKK